MGRCGRVDRMGVVVTLQGEMARLEGFISKSWWDRFTSGRFPRSG